MVCSTLNLNLDLSLRQILCSAVRYFRANAIPGRLVMETGGFWGMRPRVRRHCWVVPTVLYDFRLRPEGPPYLPSLGRISFLSSHRCTMQRDFSTRGGRVRGRRWGRHDDSEAMAFAS